MQAKAFPISLVAMMLGLASTSSLAADAAAGEKNAYPWGQQGSEQSEQDPAGVPDPRDQQGSEGAGEKNAYPWGQQGSEQSEQDPAGVPDPWGQQGSEGEGQAADPWDELSQEGSSE